MLLLSMVGNQKPPSSKAILSVVSTSCSLNDLATNQKPWQACSKNSRDILAHQQKTVSAILLVLQCVIA